MRLQSFPLALWASADCSAKMDNSKRRTPCVEFTKGMKKTHTILVPSMLDFHFNLLPAAFEAGGYKVKFLDNKDKNIVSCGWEYSNNDICFPANLIIGQFITALKSGKYDLSETALLLPQTGGGCRACNYIHLLRKALIKAGFENIPVISLNVSGVEKHSGFRITLPMVMTACAAVFYSDLLLYLYHKVSPYEKKKGEAKKLCRLWERRISKRFTQKKWIFPFEIKKVFIDIAKSFADIEIEKRNAKKICITGELYIKFCSLGNNNLEKTLEKKGCEIYMGGFVQYMMYLIDNCTADDRLYNRISLSGQGGKFLVEYMNRLQIFMNDALEKVGFEKTTTYLSLKKNCSWAASFGETMGDGWLISAEIIDALNKGCNDCIVAVPFGCLVSHSCARGVINKIRKRYPKAIISPLDFDSGLATVNQLNRLQMILNFT